MTATNANQHDVGAGLSAFPALDAAVITAGAGNDNVEVNGNVLTRTANPAAKAGPAMSCQIVVPYKAVLAASKTLSFTANGQDDTAVGMATAQADYAMRRARHVSSGGVVTNLALTAGALAATVVATDSGSGSTLRGVLLLDFDLSSAREFFRLQITADLNASGTDTVALGAVAVLGGLVEKPA